MAVKPLRNLVDLPCYRDGCDGSPVSEFARGDPDPDTGIFLVWLACPAHYPNPGVMPPPPRLALEITPNRDG
jgi:hypothetical protein